MEPRYNLYVDYKIKKANTRGFTLSQFSSSVGASPVSLAKVFVTIVRPILGYAVPVWQNIAEFLAFKIESIPKRAMRIIFPTHDYNEALSALSLPTLMERRPPMSDLHC